MSHALRKSGFNASARSIVPGQPEHSVWAELSRNPLLLVKLLHVKRTSLPHDSVDFLTKWILWISKILNGLQQAKKDVLTFK